MLEDRWIVTRWNWQGVPYTGKHWKEVNINNPPEYFLRKVDAEIAAHLMMKISGVLFVVELDGEYRPDVHAYANAVMLERRHAV